MGIAEILSSNNHNSMQTVTHNRRTDRSSGVEKSTPFSQIITEKPKTCPYDYLAKDGLIEYNGVTFVCDYKTNSICLGDVTNEKEVLNISLPSGGNLKVNVNNFGDLAMAAGMFSPADLNAIMRAIAQYNHCTSKLDELEEEETETVENAMETGAEQIEESWEDPVEVTKKDADLKFADWQAFQSLFQRGGVSKDNLVGFNDTWTWKNK